jgi:hypothetical protein
MTQTGNSVALVGEPEIGKSSLLYHLCATQADWFPSAKAIYLDLATVVDEVDFCAEVLARLGRELGDLRALKRALREEQVVLLLDEVERLADAAFSPLHGLLRALAQGRTLTLVVASRSPLAQVLPDTSPTSPLHNIFTEKRLGPFDSDEARAFLDHRLRRTGMTFAPEEVERLMMESGGHPARLQRLSYALFERKAGQMPEEVALSLVILARLIGAEDLEAVAASQEAIAWLDTLAGKPLRPQVLEALRCLGDVAAEVARSQQMTGRAMQTAALRRAGGMLNELVEYVENIHLPEHALLRLAVRRWQSLLEGATRHLGERVLREVPSSNPYKTGDPVYPPLFVGRGGVFNRIREVWTSKADPDSIILYGHRRMGKSSILRNLGDYAPPGHLLVYVDLKGETAFAEGTHHLLRGLAGAVAWAARERGLDVPEPDPADYLSPAEAGPTFRRHLRRTLAALPEGASLVLALDEFEAVDDGVSTGKIGREIYGYLRALSQEPRLVLVFAGLHTLGEMSRDYRAAFFGSYVNICVSYLSPEAAERLIARPTPDFPLNYDPAVVQRIIHETHGQPLLVQRVCQELVNHVNHELFDLEREREARVLPEDLKAVLSDEFVWSETRYFDGIWTDQVAGRASVETVLRVLASGPATAEGLAQALGLPAAEVGDALTYLKTRDLAAADAAGRWGLLVPLMRRWLRLRAEQG